MDIEYILKNSAGNLYWKDRDGRYQGANDAFIALMNTQISNDFIGKTDREIFSSVMNDEKLKIIEQTDQRIIKTGKEECIREEGVDISGNPAFYITKKMPLRDEKGKIIGVMGTSIDITKEVQSEEKAKKFEALALKSEAKAASEEEMRKTVMVLVGDIVHDLRTPIATIRTAASVLSKIHPAFLDMAEELKKLGGQKTELLNPKQWNYMLKNAPISAIQSAISTIDDFINSSLVELAIAQKAQDSELTRDDLTKCSSRRILENTLDAFPSLPKDIKLHENTSYDFYLMGNSILIMKMIINLLRNAIEQITINRDGKGDIIITTENSGDNNYLKIKDTGGGAPPEIVANFFKGYFTTKKNGTGIGLAFCKKTMETFGGDIFCHSIYGESMEFILSFPKVDEE